MLDCIRYHRHLLKFEAKSWRLREPSSRDVAEEVFDLLDRRKYNSAMILTSNRDIDEWADVFPDSVLASSTMDRMFEKAETIIFKGESYRLKGRIMTREIDRAKENT